MIQIGSGAKWLHRSPEHSGHSDEELTDDHVVGVRDVAQPSRLSAVCMELNRASLIVLVAEDETLIAMGMEDALRRAGYTVGGVFATSTSAFGWLENYRADAAVLDFCLRDRHCVQLLRELRARGTPIIIYSATHSRTSSMTSRAS